MRTCLEGGSKASSVLEHIHRINQATQLVRATHGGKGSTAGTLNPCITTPQAGSTFLRGRAGGSRLGRAYSPPV
jgi:hypothetical protein